VTTPNPSRRARAGKPSRAEEKRARLAAAEAELARQRRRVTRRRLWLGAALAVVLTAIVLLDVYVLNHASHAKPKAPATPVPATPAAATPGTGQTGRTS